MAEVGVWTVPGYVVHERLDAGLVSATYLASRASDGYPVLLQVVSEEFSDPGSADQFFTTLERVAELEHPVIPKVRDMGQADGLLYVITSATEGRPLAAALGEVDTLPLDDALDGCTELADALDTMAAVGLVHGALSPKTIWLNDRNRTPSAPRVTLHGFGTLPLRTSAVRQTSAAPPADLLYTAPEQVHGTPISERTDQYALTCAAVHCLTGRPPFDRATIGDLLAAHARDDPATYLGAAGWLPPKVAEGLARGLAKDPRDRFDTCTALTTAIGGVSRSSWSWMLDGADTATAVGSVGNGSSGFAARNGTAVADPAVSDPQAGAGPRAGGATRRRSGATIWRGAAAFVLLAAVAAAAVVLLPPLLAADRSEPGLTADGAPLEMDAPEVAASWNESMAAGTVTALVPADEQVIGASGASVTSVDQATGRTVWTASVNGEIRELSEFGPMAIVRTDDGFYGLDVVDGSVVWEASSADLPAVDTFITARGRMFGAGHDEEGQLLLHAFDPQSGELGWTIETAGGTGDQADAAGTLLAFDGSTQGRRSLYVADGGHLEAFDVNTRRQRWEADLDDLQPTSMIARDGAVLVVGDNGEVCRYEAEGGQPAWSSCAKLEHEDVPTTITQVSDSQVIICSPNEVLSIDYATGASTWRIVSREPMRQAIVSNGDAAFMAMADGTVAAIALDDGTTQWRSRPFNDVSAMAATDDALFVTSADGRMTRLETGANT
jgi:hypothetical protein